VQHVVDRHRIEARAFEVHRALEQRAHEETPIHRRLDDRAAIHEHGHHRGRVELGRMVRDDDARTRGQAEVDLAPIEVDDAHRAQPPVHDAHAARRDAVQDARTLALFAAPQQAEQRERHVSRWGR
jgi:hypothetical protein